MGKNVTFTPSSVKRGPKFPQAPGGTGIRIGRDGGTSVKPGKAPSKGAKFVTNPKASR